MSYTTDDFKESISRVGVKPLEIDVVLSAWGHGTGMGDDSGDLKWSADGATDWCGGFLLQMVDGSFVYVTGWCDYTGWGCQDGAYIYKFQHRPTSADILAAVIADKDNFYGEEQHVSEESQWDTEPADLNRWLKSSEAMEG